MSKSKKGKKQRTIDTLEKQLASRDKDAESYDKVINVQLNTIDRLRLKNNELLMERNGKQSLLMSSQSVIKDLNRKVSDWKCASTFTLLAFIGILVAYAVKLNGLG